jgi:hypothetical protein
MAHFPIRSKCQAEASPGPFAVDVGERSLDTGEDQKSRGQSSSISNLAVVQLQVPKLQRWRKPTFGPLVDRFCCLCKQTTQESPPCLFFIKQAEVWLGTLDVTKEQPSAHKSRKVKGDVYAVSGEKRRLLCTLASAHRPYSYPIEPNTQTTA